MQYFGTIYLRITSANGAYPLANANAYLVGMSPAIQDLRIGLYSNTDGVTPTVSVEAPPPLLSNTPNGSEKGCSLLNVTVTAEGYYKKTISGVSVFPDIETLLPVNMIPYSRNDVNNNKPNDYNVVLE